MPKGLKLVVATCVVLLIMLFAGLLVTVQRSRSDDRENVVNVGLHGSRPPQGQGWPEHLASVDGVVPSFPTRSDVTGRATMLVATCIDCRSGDVIGGFLGRITDGDLPDDARIVVLTWGGDPTAWRERWGIDASGFEWHSASTSTAARVVRKQLGIGSVDGADESGAALIFDASGAWRASYSIGQLNREDIAHDLAVLGDTAK